MNVQYTRQAFNPERRSEVQAAIRRKGFDPVLINDPPDFRYPPHEHPEKKLLVFLEGSMQVTAGGQTYECAPGDELLIPGNQTHSALTGAQGCTFYWSEKL